MPTLKALAEMVGGTVLGDASYEISDLADLQSAGSSDLSFLAASKYLPQFHATRAGGVLVASEIADSHTNLVVCSNPYLALAQIAGELHPLPQRPAGISPQAFVHQDAEVDPSACVDALAYVDAGARIGAGTYLAGGAFVGNNAQIGKDVIVHPGAKVLDRCVVGDRTVLHAGSVVGSDGFGYAPDATGRRHKIPQIGIVVIGEDVEVGANTTIDRATFGTTVIGPGTKLDNLVQIAHNVKLGTDVVVASQSGVAGSTTLGDGVVLGAQSGVVGHLKVEDRVVLASRAGVTKDIRSAGIYGGFPAKPHRQWLKNVASQNTIPELKRKIRELEQAPKES